MASSSDGSCLIAAENNGGLYTSPDSGVTWTERGTRRNWTGAGVSGDGGTFVALDGGGFIYVSTGTTGSSATSIAGDFGSGATLYYMGEATFFLGWGSGSLTGR